MNTAQYAILNTTVAGTTFSTIELSAAEVTSALASFPNLGAATRGGAFSPIAATATDTVAVEVREDGTARIIVEAVIPPTTTTTVTETGNSSS
jgi:hypothetical protein